MMRIHDGVCVEALFEDDPQASVPEQYRAAARAIELLKQARAGGVVLAIERASSAFPGEFVEVITVCAAGKVAGQGAA